MQSRAQAYHRLATVIKDSLVPEARVIFIQLLAACRTTDQRWLKLHRERRKLKRAAAASFRYLMLDPLLAHMKARESRHRALSRAYDHEKAAKAAWFAYELENPVFVLHGDEEDQADRRAAELQRANIASIIHRTLKWQRIAFLA
ncbi:MAG: hypothetical protein AB7G06_06425 [Bdellovibrionales bacterium]